LTCRADNKPGGIEEEEEEGDEDDGFGTMSISAQRLPNEDNALTRFFHRAMLNNGEV
jgi:hypothetical protein